jgi:C4-type Zn-finger protein
MPVAIACPHCDQMLRFPDHLYGQPAQCPLCSGAFHVRWRKLRHPNHAAELLAERLPCRFCGKAIRAEALKCPFCRRWLNTER